MSEPDNIEYVDCLGAAKGVEDGKLKWGPKRHSELPADLLQKANAIHAKIGKYHPDGCDHAAWIDGFLYDQHPEREIRIWEQITEVWELYHQDIPIQSVKWEKQIIAALCCISSGNKPATPLAKYLAKLYTKRFPIEPITIAPHHAENPPPPPKDGSHRTTPKDI